MARGKRVEDLTTIQMALVGYQIEKQKIEDKIRQLESQLKGRRAPAAAASASSAPAEEKKQGKRNLSPAARRRIAAAQRKRWAEHRKRLAQGTKASKNAGSAS